MSSEKRKKGLSRAVKTAILGFGREGKSVFKHLKTHGSSSFFGNDKRAGADKREIWILDKNPGVEAPPEARKQLGKGYLKKLDRFDLIFRSPGVPYNLPELVRARKNGVKFSSATKLFFEQLHGTAQNVRGASQKKVRTRPRSPAGAACANPRPTIIGVTGTKGKGTTVALLAEMLKAHEEHIKKTARKNARIITRKVRLAGNVGTPALDILPQIKDGDYVILELSSFQLQDLKASPQIAVILDIFPDHQDAHLNLREYYEAKANIARHQGRGGKVFYLASGKKSKTAAKRSKAKKIEVDAEKFRLFGPENVKIPGEHNFKNAVMAATVAKNLGVPGEVVLEAVQSFGGVEHRLEFVRNIAGVAYYNDSASTNPDTAAAAIRTFSRQPKIIIAGGKDKGLDYKPLARALKNSNTKLVVLFGENKRKIATAIKRVKNVESKITEAADLETAVKIARENAKIGSFVIFSPGAASFDLFQDYAERGREFKKNVDLLARAASLGTKNNWPLQEGVRIELQENSEVGAPENLASDRAEAEQIFK